MKIIHFCIVVLALLGGCTTPRQIPQAAASGHSPAPPVILISIDGFRPDYLGRGSTPHLDALAADGVRAKGMRPSFPTKTFPNHYTLVTGLRPDHHGLVGNVMKDARMPGVTFETSNKPVANDPRWWDEAEPIWLTAEKAGMRTASMFWPGSAVAIHGVHPRDWRAFDQTVTPDERVDTVLGWFDRPEAERPRFVTLYFDQIDHAGHTWGPAAPETAAAVAAIDTVIGRLRRGLAARHVAADLIVVSDHGMAPVSEDRVIRIAGIVPPGSAEVVADGPYAGIDPLPGHDDELARALLAPHPHMTCRRRGDLPARLEYGHNPRVPAFICIAETGWSILGGKTKEPVRGGAHGYDNMDAAMLATFVAAGPDFRRGVVLDVFDNVDVYPLVMRLLSLPPRANDGTAAPFASALTAR
ncbi:ectonucleotide pyrophosphatase/phosphodiesterase [Novosphingobium mangrovi (ex Huang et al. 2023)]|uniref:Ectonucleotide pyrophosphatase/phosphodiesterase n=1 Tax=Novosphingobium mangrovi (ex Huang et al. 2023) TaxID=2976432 RepID=A0ABT2I0D9_9SPHN|nr:ectonucleotide pyrophosphatase/phosphodiesterase [Novosphingobium mangrovi (ex Huang et al. 2023)]MCT2398267.1 ectonucleotide pyrophosphatase/phosphodiesterase [Novosphingobium mangrovi (ex Huang et al. 2023)]